MPAQKTSTSAEEILKNNHYKAICYGGYREKSRDIQPTTAQLIEDLKILSAMGIKILRTYNVHLPEAENLLKAIAHLKNEIPEFEMYVMLGAWIDCKNAWTSLPLNHNEESEDNAIEINKAVTLIKQYPDIIKILSIGNEAMVKWATSYYVQPHIILKWVKHVQSLKSNGELPSDLWVTSSDNFAAWGGGDSLYHTDDLDSLIEAVDYISIHTYPMHDTHYNPVFWGIEASEYTLNKEEQILKAMERARDYAIHQYTSVVEYMHLKGFDKPVHIGETGWASMCNEKYGPNGSKATDEYKSGLYFQLIHEWCNAHNIKCFYFEAFDEQWKDSGNPFGSENHFGLINLNGEVKYALWPMVDNGAFNGLTRDSMPLVKTYKGNVNALLDSIHIPTIVEPAHILH